MGFLSLSLCVSCSLLSFFLSRTIILDRKRCSPADADSKCLSSWLKLVWLPWKTQANALYRVILFRYAACATVLVTEGNKTARFDPVGIPSAPCFRLINVARRHGASCAAFNIGLSLLRERTFLHLFTLRVVVDIVCFTFSLSSIALIVALLSFRARHFSCSSL